MGKPEKDWKMNGISLAAWQGKTGISFSVRKSYKDKISGQWVDSKYYYVDDLKRLQNLIEQALAWVHREPEETLQIGQSVPTPENTRTANMIDDDIPF